MLEHRIASHRPPIAVSPHVWKTAAAVDSNMGPTAGDQAVRQALSAECLSVALITYVVHGAFVEV